MKRRQGKSNELIKMPKSYIYFACLSIVLLSVFSSILIIDFLVNKYIINPTYCILIIVASIGMLLTVISATKKFNLS